jgi:hypothetical protein
VVPKRGNVIDRGLDKLLLSVIELCKRRGIHRGDGCMQKEEDEGKEGEEET